MGAGMGTHLFDRSCPTRAAPFDAPSQRDLHLVDKANASRKLASLHRFADQNQLVFAQASTNVVTVRFANTCESTET